MKKLLGALFVLVLLLSIPSVAAAGTDQECFGGAREAGNVAYDNHIEYQWLELNVETLDYEWASRVAVDAQNYFMNESPACGFIQMMQWDVHYWDQWPHYAFSSDFSWYLFLRDWLWHKAGYGG